MNDVSDHEATMQLIHGYVVRKNISPPAPTLTKLWRTKKHFLFAYNDNFHSQNHLTKCSSSQ